MKLHALFFIICAIFLFGAQTHANPTTDLTKLLNAFQTLQADFVQTTYDSHGKIIQKGSGKMSLVRPGRFRWEVKQPFPQVIIANKQKLWIYDPDLEQVTIRHLNQAAGEAPALLLSHVDQALAQNFAINFIKSKSNWQWYALRSKKNDHMFANTQIGFLNGQLKEMRLTDRLGHELLIQFNNVKLNQKLADALFIFKVNKKIDVINETAT